MSLSKEVHEFVKQLESWALMPEQWQPPFQTYMESTMNDNANVTAQELQPCPTGESTAVNPGEEAVKRRLSNRRRRQRERRSLRSKPKPVQELEQEAMSSELEYCDFSQQDVNVAGYEQGPGEEQDTQPVADFYMQMESMRDVYFP